MIRIPGKSPRSLSLLLAAAVVALALPARASDSKAPEISHTPIARVAAGPLKVQARITDESKIFPQVFFRSGAGAYEPPMDMKKVKGAKDLYEAFIPIKGEAVEYYLECYDEYGNGPGRSADPEHPHRVLLGDRALATGSSPTAAGAREVAVSAAPPPGSPAAAQSAPKEAHESSEPAPDRALSTTLAAPPPSFTAEQALWHSAILPGWGQYRSERRLRGVLFGAATGVSLAASIWLGVRAKQANDTYQSAPLTVRQQAYDQAESYARSRNAAILTTVAIYAVNVAEAYLLHGTKDPW